MGKSTGRMSDGSVPLRNSDIAYEELLERILDLRLYPGMVVNEQMLATSVGVGRMPVREALARLVTDQFIAVLPRRGTVVAPLDFRSVAHIFDAREAIECGIVHVVARRITPPDLMHLRQLVHTVEQDTTANDTVSFLAHDKAVHTFLVELMDNPLVFDTAERLLMHNIRFWRAFFASRPDIPFTMISYDPLLAALERGDGDDAARAMRDHLAIARKALQAAF
jgi:DNA-binding GntR family transcriptional regulator